MGSTAIQSPSPRASPRACKPDLLLVPVPPASPTDSISSSAIEKTQRKLIEELVLCGLNRNSRSRRSDLSSGETETAKVASNELLPDSSAKSISLEPADVAQLYSNANARIDSLADTVHRLADALNKCTSARIDALAETVQRLDEKVTELDSTGLDEKVAELDSRSARLAPREVDNRTDFKGRRSPQDSQKPYEELSKKDQGSLWAASVHNLSYGKVQVDNLGAVDTEDQRPDNATAQWEETDSSRSSTQYEIACDAGEKIKAGETVKAKLTVLDDMAEYKLNESIWDLGMLIGLRQMGHCGSVVVLALLTTAVCIQMCFCIILEMNFTQNPYNDNVLQGLNDFRLRNAQMIQYADHVAGKRLAQKMCDPDVDPDFAGNSLINANAQMQMLMQVEGYLQESDAGTLEGLFDRMMMCILAMACWILVILADARELYHFIASIASLPRSTETVFEQSVGDPSKLVIVSLAWRRRFIFFFICAMRFTVCACLLFVGCKWLSYTTDPENLVLNAAALNFIFDIDDYFFDAVAPLPSKVFLRAIRPIKERGWVSFKGLDHVTLGCLILFIGLSIHLYLVNVLYMVSSMRDIEHILCGGELQFFFGIDPQMGMLWYKEMPPLSSSKSALETQTLQSVSEVINGKTPAMGNNASSHPFNPVDFRSIDYIERATLVDTVNPACEDLLGPTDGSQSLVSWIRVVTSIDSVHNCYDLRHLCGVMTEEFYWVRFLCPIECQCVKPDSIVPSHDSKFGCPSACFYGPKYEKNLNILNCSDRPAAELANAAFWKSWYKQAKQFVLQATQNETLADSYLEGMLTKGCKWLEELEVPQRRDACEGSATMMPIRPFSPICPETCRCHIGTWNCAPQCINEFDVWRSQD